MGDEFNESESNGFASVLAHYLLQVDLGATIDREAFLAEHPEHVVALRNYFADLDLIQQLAGGSSKHSAMATDAAPSQFGEYELLGEVGRGGMGIVYRAKERSTGRCLALKMLLNAPLLSSAEVQRFRNEASTAAAVRHRGIIPIYHVGEQQGRLFYTMPLIEGSNLAERIAEGPLAPATAAKVLLAVAEAVAAAHAHGIVHRDLKPANVLLDEHQIPLVADFGLARRSGAEQLGLTLTGDLLGTPNYMAPEQVNGQQALVGHLTDVYALGAILYAMLVGWPPFRSESVSDTLHKICTTDPVRPRRTRRGLPRDLETICLKCLEKSPDRRYQSADNLVDDVRRFLAGEPLLAQPVSRIERGRRWFKRNPVVGTLAVGIALALLGGTSFSLYYAHQAMQREQQALDNLYAADMNIAQQRVRSGQIESAVRLLERHRTEPDATGGHDWEWCYLWHLCHAELRRFDGPRDDMFSAAVSPDGQTVAAVGTDRAVWIWETSTGKVKHRLQGHSATVRDLSFAPDGRMLATVGDDHIGIVWDTATGERIATLYGHERPLTTVAFSADGCLLATGGPDDARVDLWDIPKFSLRQSLELGPTESLAFAPTGDERLAIAGRDGVVRICRRDKSASWSLAEKFLAHDDVINDVAWSPRGTLLATAGHDDAIKLWDAASRHQVAAFGPLQDAALCVNFSPDGRRLTAAVRNEPLKLWDIERPQFAAELLGYTASMTSVFSPNGWRLLTAGEDGTVRLWAASQATEHDRLDGHLGRVRALAFSPDGKTLASGGLDDDTVILWNAETCRPRQVLRSIRGGITDLAFSPDGASVAAAELNGHLQVWDVKSGAVASDTNPTSNRPLVGVGWSPDGLQLAILANDQTIRVVEANSGDQLAVWSAPRGPHGSIVFSADGKLMATATGDRCVQVWDTTSHALVQELEGHTALVVNAVFNPAGSMIASSSNDHTIRLWDTATGRQLRTLSGHSGTPFGLAFSPDGSRLASSSTDKTVKIWDVATGLELQSLDGNRTWARDVAFSPDGQHLATAGYDGTVRIWHAPMATGTVPIFPIPRGTKGLSPSRRADLLQSADWSTAREAAALVDHLSNRFSDREPLVAAIKADPTISDQVRAAAISQANEYLFYWPYALAGHRAAQRRDWPAAIEAFERVTTLAPDEVMHWHWLAMASIAAGRRESYQRACDELLRRYDAKATPRELYWTLKTWLVLPRDGKELVPLRPLVDATRGFHESQGYRSLYELRTGELPADIEHTTMAMLGPHPENCYAQAMAWNRACNRAKAESAYREGLRRERFGTTYDNWYGDVYREALRKEVEAMLAAAPCSTSDSQSSATSAPAPAADSGLRGDQAPSPQPPASK